jgi:hypothetical protein
MIRLALALALVGCSVPDIDLAGKACPCPDGWVCTPANTCARAALPDDAQPLDGASDGSNGGIDAQVIPSCLGMPLSHMAYTTSTFADFGTAWTTKGGTWAVSNSNLVQSSATADVSVAAYSVTASDYRVVSTYHATSTGIGLAIELALRINIAGSNLHVYHCNWEPSDGAFLIQRTDSTMNGAVLQEVTIDTNAIPNYKPSDPITMEFQAIGNSLTCCLHDITGATLGAVDNTYSTGGVGTKTYKMSAVYDDFTVYTP